MTYVNSTPPCGHSNGTHPSGCWYVAVCDAVAVERARIIAAVKDAQMRRGSELHDVGRVWAAVLRIVEDKR